MEMQLSILLLMNSWVVSNSILLQMVGLWLFSYLFPDAHMKYLTKKYLPGLEHLSQKGHPSLALPVVSSYSSKSFKFTLLPAMWQSSSCFTLLPKLGIHSFIHLCISLNKKLLSPYNVPATILGVENALVNKT